MCSCVRAGDLANCGLLAGRGPRAEPQGRPGAQGHRFRAQAQCPFSLSMPCTSCPVVEGPPTAGPPHRQPPRTLRAERPAAHTLLGLAPPRPAPHAAVWSLSGDPAGARGLAPWCWAQSQAGPPIRSRAPGPAIAVAHPPPSGAILTILLLRGVPWEPAEVLGPRGRHLLVYLSICVKFAVNEAGDQAGAVRGGREAPDVSSRGAVWGQHPTRSPSPPPEVGKVTERKDGERKGPRRGAGAGTPRPRRP